MTTTKLAQLLATMTRPQIADVRTCLVNGDTTKGVTACINVTPAQVDAVRELMQLRTHTAKAVQEMADNARPVKSAPRH